MEWNQMIAALINTVLVMFVVQVLKVGIPILNTKLPWVLPILAAAVGPVVALVQNALSAWLGIPIDLSPIAAMFTGASAVMVHQVYRQAAK